MSLVQCGIIRNHRQVGSSYIPSTLMHRRASILANPVLVAHSQRSNNGTFENSSFSTSAIQNSPTNQEMSQGSCKECLYTGVATCSGLSLYFMKLASELPDAGAKEVMRQTTKQKRFLLGGSAVWAVAGAYRLYLG